MPTQQDLVSIAQALVAPGKGILAADESTGTIEKRFDSIKVENVEENRRAYRDMLFTTKGLGQYISGVILYDETLRQKSSDGTPFGDVPVMAAKDALRTIAAFRLALPRTVLRYAGGRELTLGDLGTRDGLLGGINAVIVGNYLTTLGRDPRADLALLADLQMPVKALNATL